MTTTLADALRATFKKTNILPLNSTQLPFSPEHYLARVLHHLPNCNQREFTTNFDPIETILLQKIVSTQTLDQRVVLQRDFFFPGLIYLDYFTAAMTRSTTIFSKLQELDENIARVHPSMDITTSIGVHFIAHHYAMHNMARRQRPTPKRELQPTPRRAREQIQYHSLQPHPHAYNILGTMIYNMLTTPEVRSALPHVTDRITLQQAVFTDMNLRFVQEEKNKQKTIKKLEAGNLYSAALHSLEALSTETTPRTIQDAIRELKQHYEARAS